MSRPFQELRDKMSPGAQAESQAKANEMSAHIQKSRLSFWERLTEAVHVRLSRISQDRKRENYEDTIGGIVDDEYKKLFREQIRKRRASNKIRKRRILNKIARRSRKINYGTLNKRSKRWAKE